MILLLLLLLIEIRLNDLMKAFIQHTKRTRIITSELFVISKCMKE